MKLFWNRNTTLQNSFPEYAKQKSLQIMYLVKCLVKEYLFQWFSCATRRLLQYIIPAYTKFLHFIRAHINSTFWCYYGRCALLLRLVALLAKNAFSRIYLYVSTRALSIQIWCFNFFFSLWFTKNAYLSHTHGKKTTNYSAHSH